ncbi:MAG TPA: flagellar hook-length control protein FliK [Caulobacteraceae bacterium]|nr:flagellar hook-length control protein FliK [Caulobacteraceae bacterium]
MVAPADIPPIGAAPAVAPTGGLALVTGPAAAVAARNVATIASQLAVDLIDPATAPLAAAEPSPVAAMVADAATRQQGLAPLLADLPAAAESPALPPAARAVATQILAAQAPLGAEVTGEELQAAARASGVFLEAALAAALTAGAAPPELQQDLKALLTQLSAELAPLVEQPPPRPQSGAPVTSPPPAARPPAESPTPPVAGGPTTGQRAAQPSVGPDASVATIARALHQEAQGALARVQLSQAASIPQPAEPARWTFDIPIATPAGTGLAQLEISRDGRGSGGPAAEPGWRARVSIDAAPSGPVHADVLLAPGRTRVTLTAEHDSARVALAASQSELVQALAAEQGPDVAVRVVGGAPAPPSGPPGQLVDRRS